jgi:hypothetical protein
VVKIVEAIHKQVNPATNSARLESWLPWILFAAAIFVLFFKLGQAALFEPDEGRNAEKAREILVLNDWITPHENYHPVLDKPIFFYWLIALSYQLFGISEWAARLPSALAALGCLAVVYCFVRTHWGFWPALWAGLILLTSLEFFVLARLVIFDMALTFFLTVALCAFYQAGHTDDVRRRRWLCLFMYGALGAATLIKGLIGIVLPGMVIFGYLLLSKRGSILRRIYLVPGILLLLAIVLPWYLQADARNVGYLKYYFWDEHFGRYATASFDRTQPWYYFILVLLAGFSPWTLLLPFVSTQYHRKTCDDLTLFLLLWAVLPLLFFSFSKSKLPHYILPMFPALAILTAAALVRMLAQPTGKIRRAVYCTWIAEGLMVLYFVVGSIRPVIMPHAIRTGVVNMADHLWLYGALIVLVPLLLLFRRTSGKLPHQPLRFLTQAYSTILFLFFVAELMVAVAPFRSAKALAGKAATRIAPTTQLVFYDTYLAAMGFYLRTEQPIWVITHGKKKRTFLGNYYALSNRAEPVTRWGKSLLNFDEFARCWQSAQQPLLIFAKERNLAHLTEQIGATPTTVAGFNGYVVLAK